MRLLEEHLHCASMKGPSDGSINKSEDAGSSIKSKDVDGSFFSKKKSLRKNKKKRRNKKKKDPKSHEATTEKGRVRDSSRTVKGDEKTSSSSSTSRLHTSASRASPTSTTCTTQPLSSVTLKLRSLRDMLFREKDRKKAKRDAIVLLKEKQQHQASGSSSS